MSESKEKITPKEIHVDIFQTLGEDTPSYSTVKKIDFRFEAWEAQHI